MKAKSKTGTPENTETAVQYIGRRETFTDRSYGSGLTFTRDQVRRVPADLARRLLKHRDLFQAADADAEEAADDDTKTVIAKHRDEHKKKQLKENEIQDVIDQVQQMTKASLSQFAREKFRHEFKANEKVDDMRKQTLRMIHQFGVV